MPLASVATVTASANAAPSNVDAVSFSFASTYTLGQLGKRYYGGGRTMSGALLKQTFNELLAPAKELQAKYLPKIQEKARNLNMADVISMLKGQKV